MSKATSAPAFEVGSTVKQFTVLSKTAKVATLQCVCGRVRTFSASNIYRMLAPTGRQSCGCNSADQVIVGGDPHLPAGVTTQRELIAWGGRTNASFYDLARYRGFSYAVQHLAKVAEKRHPGEGWRILKILPVEREAPPRAQRTSAPKSGRENSSYDREYALDYRRKRAQDPERAARYQAYQRDYRAKRKAEGSDERPL